MRVVVQRVSQASVQVGGEVISSIGHGYLIYACWGQSETQADLQWIADKIASLRLFNDEEGKINKSVTEVDGDLLVISQFSLLASTRKGNRPSFINSAPYNTGHELYKEFVQLMNDKLKGRVKQGVFGAEMKVRSENDGPLTIIIDSKVRE